MKGFIYAMLILSAIVFLYRAGFAFPDLAASFGGLSAAYNSQVYNMPLGSFSASGAAQRYEAAANNLPQNYYAAGFAPQNAPFRTYIGN